MSGDSIRRRVQAAMPGPAARVGSARKEACGQMDFDPIIHAISQNFFWFAGTLIAVIAIGGAYVRDIIRIRAQERTRREIAAYIAEGSMDAEQGERLMKAAPDEED